MKIIREVNGQQMEFELTDHELWEAYREQEHLFDMEDVCAWLDDMEDDAPGLTDDQIEEAATLARNWMDGNDHMAECRWDCINDAIREVLE